jgi:transposase InsO family protein
VRVEALRRSSREIVDGERPIRRAISRTPSDWACKIAISSRSANDRRRPDTGASEIGGIPPACLGKTTVQKHLVEAGLGRRAQRVARAAAVAALTGGLVTEPVAEAMLFGFCHWAARPGDLVAVDSFYIGNLKGVGKVYQLTATRWAIIQIVLGPVTAEHTRRFITQVQRRFRRMDWPLRAVVSDNGPEYRAMRFRDHLADLGLIHHRIPPRSPNHNAVCERFQGTALQECWRPAFHRRRFRTIRHLQAEADAWLIAYHHRRRNHGDFMAGRTPPAGCSTVTAPSEQHDHQPQRPSVLNLRPGSPRRSARKTVPALQAWTSAVPGRRHLYMGLRPT